jgi:hypothetical protein
VKRVLAAAAFALCLSGGAAASGTIVPVGAGADPPALAGDAAVWGRQVHGGYEVVVQRWYTGKRRRLRFAAVGTHNFAGAKLAASPTRVAVGLQVFGCDMDCAVYYDAFNAAAVGGLSGPLTTLAGHCPARYEDEYEVVWSAPPIDVSGDVVAYTDCNRDVHVRDLAGTDRRDLPAADDLRVAGSFVASRRESGELTVFDWRTGEALFTVASGREFDVDSDGTVAFATADDDAIAWASPAEPTAHVIARAARARPRIAAGRIAYSIPEIDGQSYEARLPSGALVARTRDPTATSPADFDGQRLAWVTRPCRQEWLAVWDGTGSVPRPPAGQCPFPRVRHGSVRVNGHGHLTARIDCPEVPGLGCLANLAARNPAYTRSRNGGIDGLRDYQAAPGVTKRVLFARGPHAICHDRRGRMRTQLLIRVSPRPGTARANQAGGFRDRTHLVTVHGEGRHVRSCRSGVA